MNITISDSDSNEVQDSMRITKDRKNGCPFCEIPKQRILEEDELCYVIRDGFPVTDLHTLVIPKRHVETYFDLYQPELNSCNRMNPCFSKSEKILVSFENLILTLIFKTASSGIASTCS